MDYTNCGPLESDDDYVTQFSSCERFLRNLSVLSNVARQNMYAVSNNVFLKASQVIDS